jgi:hypothetical protein
VYPNPASNWIHAVVSTEKRGLMKWYIRDITGRTIITELVELLPDLNQIDLDIKQLSAGPYVLIMRFDDSEYSQKFVVSE